MSSGSRPKRHKDTDSDRSHKSRESNFDDIPIHTSNPRLIEARIFVGNVTFPRVSQSDLEDKFSKYGQILGISVHRGFAFVQFKKSSCADKAIKEEHLAMFKGKRIDVKTAATSEDNMRSNGRGRSRSQRSLSPKHSRDHPREGSREGSRDVDDREWENRIGGRERSPLHKRDLFDDRYRDTYKRDMNYRFPSDIPPYGFPEDRSAVRPYEEEPSREPPREDVLDPNRPNDCEIIVVLKHLRAYAESVERRLKNLGLTVDLLFLKDEAALLPTIDDIARRGSLFAIVVADQNEAHRSVTLNILYGTPQEHRNMPLDDAMKLVAINYHEYVQSLRDKKMRGVQGSSSANKLAAVTTPAAVANPVGLAVPGIPVIPAALAALAVPGVNLPIPSGRSSKLQNLLTMLSEGKYLTAAEIGVVIEYLSQQRNEILSRERGDHLQENIASQSYPLSSDASIVPSNLSQEVGHIPPVGGFGEQNPPANWHYDNSLNSPAVTQVPAVAPVQEQLSASSRSNNSFLNFDNPTVQRALDSLIQSGPNLLQKVLGSTDQSSDRDEKSQIIPSAYNQGPSMSGNAQLENMSMNLEDQHQSMRRNQISPTPNIPRLHDQYGSSNTQNAGPNYGNAPKQEDHFMQRQPQYSQSQRQYPSQTEEFNAPQHADRSGGVRHPLMGTPIPNRFSSAGMGRSGMQRQHKHDNFY
ncbi:Nuclear receptor coactivator 5 [Nymphon striatum]|nr:Nuclear receptor coactivator 5 [Nymphon striatum]